MPGRRFSYWIGEALRDARESAGIPIGPAAASIGMSPLKIQRIEGAKGEGLQSYKDIDRIVAAYAYLLGIADPRELWIDALDRWIKEGGIPNFEDDLPGTRFLRPIREEAQRQPQVRGELEERLRAMRPRRGGGR